MRCGLMKCIRLPVNNTREMSCTGEYSLEGLAFIGDTMSADPLRQTRSDSADGANPFSGESPNKPSHLKHKGSPPDEGIIRLKLDCQCSCSCSARSEAPDSLQRRPCPFSRQLYLWAEGRTKGPMPQGSGKRIRSQPCLAWLAISPMSAGAGKSRDRQHATPDHQTGAPLLPVIALFPWYTFASVNGSLHRILRVR